MSAPARPTFTKRNAIFARSEATRTSEASAITDPAPAAIPFTAATIGFRKRRMFRIRSQVIRVNSTSPGMSRAKSSPMIEFTSPPEQNPRPSPVITTERTSGSFSRSRNRSRSSA